jgi:NADP-dependent 3-hydroxy acid dehydrogenase YdfG
MIELKNKRVLITGGAMGIGKETVTLLLNEGCGVTLWDTNEEAMAKAAQEWESFGDKLSWSLVDITDRDKVYSMAEKIIKDQGVPDIIINNAGIMRRGTFLEGSDADWDLTLDVNLNGVIYITRAFLPEMYKKNSGHIVNISSAAGLLGVSGLAVYAAAKWAVHGLTDSLREEARKEGKQVKFSSIHPFYVATGLFEGAQIKGLGNLLVPRVKNHGVIAHAIVEYALKRGQKKVYRPRSLFLVDLMKGIFPFPLFIKITRWLKVQQSMDTHRGYTTQEVKK